jgi:hypothetical protein
MFSANTTNNPKEHCNALAMEEAEPITNYEADEELFDLNGNKFVLQYHVPRELFDLNPKGFAIGLVQNKSVLQYHVPQ